MINRAYLLGFLVFMFLGNTKAQNCQNIEFSIVYDTDFTSASSTQQVIHLNMMDDGNYQFEKSSLTLNKNTTEVIVVWENKEVAVQSNIELILRTSNSLINEEQTPKCLSQSEFIDLEIGNKRFLNVEIIPASHE